MKQTPHQHPAEVKTRSHLGSKRTWESATISHAPIRDPIVPPPLSSTYRQVHSPLKSEPATAILGDYKPPRLTGKRTQNLHPMTDNMNAAAPGKVLDLLPRKRRAAGPEVRAERPGGLRTTVAGRPQERPATAGPRPGLRTDAAWGRASIQLG
eukprot:TRINITY_DN102280_c0_g1_i1.p1 TRINITY_DN102280_c0_g1~~TRINITY_DN102280_c0_g1_i1.p1  ORF type:complete len:161 (-),score=13.72 TRINITY_DN102280_c0_g1_i1:144-602(-)